MNFLNLQYFLVAAEERSFTRAARRLHISQQSLSGHISRLERHFGVPLFTRGVRLLGLTPAGECLRVRARVLLAQWDQTHTDLFACSLNSYKEDLPC